MRASFTAILKWGALPLFTWPSGYFCGELAAGIPRSAPNLAVMSIHLSFIKPIMIPKLIYFSY